MVKFLVFMGNWRGNNMLVDKVDRIVGAGEWLDEFGKVAKSTLAKFGTGKM